MNDGIQQMIEAAGKTIGKLPEPVAEAVKPAEPALPPPAPRKILTAKKK